MDLVEPSDRLEKHHGARARDHRDVVADTEVDRNIGDRARTAYSLEQPHPRYPAVDAFTHDLLRAVAVHHHEHAVDLTSHRQHARIALVTIDTCRGLVDRTDRMIVRLQRPVDRAAEALRT